MRNMEREVGRVQIALRLAVGDLVGAERGDQRILQIADVCRAVVIACARLIHPCSLLANRRLRRCSSTFSDLSRRLGTIAR